MIETTIQQRVHGCSIFRVAMRSFRNASTLLSAIAAGAFVRIERMPRPAAPRLRVECCPAEPPPNDDFDFIRRATTAAMESSSVNAVESILTECLDCTRWWGRNARYAFVRNVEAAAPRSVVACRE